MNINAFLAKSQFTFQAHATPEWLFNGSWAIKYRAFGRSKAFTRADLLKLFPPAQRKTIREDDLHVREHDTDRVVKASFPIGELSTFRRTNRIFINSYGVICRVFAGEGDALALFNDELITAADVSTLYTDVMQRAFINAPMSYDATFLIAPMLPREVPLELTSITTGDGMEVPA
jgi:hypothetical protein